MGLGKLGGVALGYASDIELLFVYSDSGSTAGPEGSTAGPEESTAGPEESTAGPEGSASGPEGSTSGPERLDNSEFFDKLVREVLQLVHAKREGIFHIDLRLRPYGAAGPLGCSLESFCTYYASGGPAHSYERLSLVRLRAVGGDRSLGSQVERLRDEMVYSAQSIDLAELRALRARQVEEKTRIEPVPASPAAALSAIPGAAPGPVRANAKFSPGALVDLEYAVQILQVTHGAIEKRLRTPRIHEALDALASIGLVEHSEASELVAAYHFFRHLINGLRMLRGSAQDLFLPAPDSDLPGAWATPRGRTPRPCRGCTSISKRTPPRSAPLWRGTSAGTACPARRWSTRRT
jgi:glutamate-ammonia-ligase adenylyltransferase